MINRYTDHSANERTYLAWIRTALGIMAFGFLIEKAGLYASYLGSTIEDGKNVQSLIPADLVGFGFLFVGVLIIVNATIRFYMFKKLIDVDQPVPYSIKKSNIILATLMVLLSFFLLVYVGHKVLT